MDEPLQNGNQAPTSSGDANLRAALSNLNSTEVQLCALAAKDFVKLLESDNGGEILHNYVRMSVDFSELKSAWNLRREKSKGLRSVLKVVSAVLRHPHGKYVKSDGRERLLISSRIDKLARFLLEERQMNDVKGELGSEDGKRQKAALLLMGAVVRRGSGVAAEAFKVFDKVCKVFEMKGFGMLAEWKRSDGDKKRKKKRTSTREAFVKFAMSFLEVGKPALLRWVLQLKDVFFGILRGLSDDEDDTVEYVLTTLRDRVLCPESLVPPSLRSVLFGSVTLEQLISISARDGGGEVAELCHEVLVMVCTDPCNGLMPDMGARKNPLKGNHKRLLDLMKKLRATEVYYHKALLLSIVKGRPSLGSAYLDEFPYKVDDHASYNWCASALLAASVVSSVASCLSFTFFDSQSSQKITYDHPDVRSIMKCVFLRLFSRSAITKGLLHSSFSVKHGTLGLLLEVLKLLDYFLSTINGISCSRCEYKSSLMSLNQDILNDVRLFLPDLQVLLTLLSSLGSLASDQNSGSKRAADTEVLAKQNRRKTKKPKKPIIKEDTDIIIAGLSNNTDEITLGEQIGNDADCADVSHRVEEFPNFSGENWWLEPCSMIETASKNEEVYFHSKLLEAVRIYLHIMPQALESSFDFFANVLSNASSLRTYFQQSLMSLLFDYIVESRGSKVGSKTLPLMYKHLQTFINLMVFSSVGDIRKQAHEMAQSALLSTGAFDSNLSEIQAWFLFMPGFHGCMPLTDAKEIRVHHNLISVVSAFLCDAVSTVGNNLFKYWDMLRDQVHRIEGVKDTSPTFSPLVPCILQKCLRLLSSGSGTFTHSEKSVIALYVCNTLKYILQTQVDAKLFAAWIGLVLSDGFEGSSHLRNKPTVFSEWRPVRDLLNSANSISKSKAHNLYNETDCMPIDPSFTASLSEMKKIVRAGNIGDLEGLTEGLYASAICTSPDDILKNFPSTMEVLGILLEVPFWYLSSMFFLDQGLLSKVCKSWPDIFAPALESVLSFVPEKRIEDVICKVSAQPWLGDGASSDQLRGSGQPATSAFGSFLDLAPLHTVFPLFMTTDGLQLIDQFKLTDWFLFKASRCSFVLLVPTLRIALFRFFEIQSLFRSNHSAELVKLSEVCVAVIEHLLDQVRVSKWKGVHSTYLRALLSRKMLLEVAESFFFHPAIVSALDLMLVSCEKIKKQISEDRWRDFLFSGKVLSGPDAWSWGDLEIDHFALRILRKASDMLYSFSSDTSLVEDDGNIKNLSRKFKIVEERVIIGLKNRIDVCIQSGDLAYVISTIHAFGDVKYMISPPKHLVLTHWMLNRVQENEPLIRKSRRANVHAFCFHIASYAFEALASYWDQTITERITDRLGDKDLRVDLLEEVYFKIIDMATCIKLDVADTCLLSAIKAMHRLQSEPSQGSHSLRLALSRTVACTPIEFISYCINGRSTILAKSLFLLTELSPLHLSVFGSTFLEIANKIVPLQGNVSEGKVSGALSEQQLLILLPTALSYLNWSLIKFGKEHLEHVTSILSLYSRVIMKGFTNWNSYVSHSVFQEDYEDLLPYLSQDPLHLCANSLLGKTVNMLKHIWASSHGLKIFKNRLEQFDSLCGNSSEQDELLDCCISELDSYSSSQLRHFLNSVVAKTHLCRLMLFPESCHLMSFRKEENGESGDNGKESLSRIRFINMLLHSWCLIVSKSASRSAESGKSNSTISLQFKCLEMLILRTFVESVEEMRSSFIKLQTVPFLEQFVRTSLLYRFEDPTTLRMVRRVLASLSVGTYPSSLFLQLLLEHSHFVSTLRSGCSTTEQSQGGAFLRPMPSILKSVLSPDDDDVNVDGKKMTAKSDLVLIKLEVIKLLQLLFRKCRQDSEEHVDINVRELFLLLLSSYGATLSEVDTELYSLMNDIECVGGMDYGNLSAMDYLWGNAAWNVKHSQDPEAVSSNSGNEETREWRKNLFREHLLFDPKLSLMTILNFPYNQTTSNGDLANKFSEFSLEEINKVRSPAVERIKGYDPVFILRFSIHILSVGYVDPLEFAGLGLLSMAFLSISSPNEVIRKLGYEILGRFQNASEKSQKRKDVIRLRLLLTCVQNGIEEPSQQIPPVIAFFAAEGSMILLEATNDHCSDIIEYLMSFSAFKMKRIPLFDKFFWSRSLNFKQEKNWILRLCYAGLHLKEDAQIYIWSSVPENLLSYFSSPLADDESKLLILQILNKAVKLHRMARHLVENCSLLPWLSHLVSFASGELAGEKRSFCKPQLILVCEVVKEVVSSRNIAEWLQNQSLEQLVELSSHLHSLLAKADALVGEHADLVDSILQILTSAAKISQKRNIFQPHFTLSFDGLFQIYRTTSLHRGPGCDSTAELGLRAILMSTPPATVNQMTREKLAEFVMWAISMALKSDSMQIPQRVKCDPQMTLKSEAMREDSLTEKLLRWFTASVILVKVSGIAKKRIRNKQEAPDQGSLHSLLEHIYQVPDPTASESGYEDTLAATIFYLHQILGHNTRVAPSVTAALCMILFPKTINATGSASINPVDYGIHVAPLVSKVRCPPEASPKWRWTFYQAWEDRTSTPTDSEKEEEVEACEKLLRILLNVLQKRPLGFTLCLH